jgi:heat shock protein HslJ
MKPGIFAAAISGILSTLAFGAEPDTQVIEYYHPTLKHYFITASGTDALFIDSGGAGDGWVRTGRGFGGWSKRDSAPTNAAVVHRFYSPGANSHFYTGSDDEVRFLKGLEASERASIAGTSKSFLGWAYEGEAFLAVLPTNGQCPSATDAITRVYNEGFTTGEGSNHRYLDDAALRRSMEDRKWVTEAVVLCSPKASSVSATAASSNSAPLASGQFTGSVTFKFEETGKPQAKVRSTLTLTLAPDGALSGSGGGCLFSGTTTTGSTRLRTGSAMATSCNDARFNGTYNRVELEQFSVKSIDIRLRQGDNAREASIEGVLNNGTAVTSPTAPTAPSTPAPADSSLIAGDFSGISSWIITERMSGQAETIVYNVNQGLGLKISTAGVVSGAGQGCTFAGVLTPGVNNLFSGQIIASGCPNTRLNGSYAAKVHAEDDGVIDAELEREVEQAGVRMKVAIDGTLLRNTTSTGTIPTPVPVPPVSGLAIAGNYAGSSTWLATSRPTGGRETTVVDKSQQMIIALGSGGAVTGSGGGCTFSGSITLTDALLGIYTGSIAASGCSDTIVNGNYIATAARENGSGLQIELERDIEINGERTKVKIRGLLVRQ